MAAWGHPAGQASNRGFCLLTSEVHEDIAAEHHPRLGHPRARLLQGEVVVHDPYVAAKVGRDLIAPRHRSEVALEAIGRESLDLALGVLRLLSSTQCGERDIGGQDVP